jgi:hypothetical protein
MTLFSLVSSLSFLGWASIQDGTGRAAILDKVPHF